MATSSMKVALDTEEIANQYVAVVEHKIVNKIYRGEPRAEVKELVKCVEKLQSQHGNLEIIQNLVDKNLVDIVKGNDEENAKIEFIRIVDKVFSSGEYFSWGRLVAVCAFTYSIIKSLTEEDKYYRIKSVSSWLEISFLKQLTWIKQQGNGEGWKDFLVFSNNSQRSSCNYVFFNLTVFTLKCLTCIINVYKYVCRFE